MAFKQLMRFEETDFGRDLRLPLPLLVIATVVIPDTHTSSVGRAVSINHFFVIFNAANKSAILDPLLVITSMAIPDDQAGTIQHAHAVKTTVRVFPVPDAAFCGELPVLKMISEDLSK